MIFDNIQNAQNYSHFGELINKALQFLSSNDLSALPLGRIEIFEDKVFAIVQEYSTKQEIAFEAHKQFIDIQYIVEGKERLGFANLAFCNGSSGYEPEKDIEFFNSCSRINFVIARKGDFLIFYPSDAHAPSLAINMPENVKKIVIKIAV